MDDLAEVKPKRKYTRKVKEVAASPEQYQYQLVEVQWYDAETDMGWEEVEEPKLPVCTTVGFLIKENQDLLVIASTYESKHTNARIKIPRLWLKSFKVIKVC